MQTRHVNISSGARRVSINGLIQRFSSGTSRCPNNRFLQEKPLYHTRQRVRRSVLVRAEGRSTPLKIMIMGAPAAGKGTQCEKIVQEHSLVHISVGDLLRAEVAAGTPEGKRAKEYMESGKLVPNEVVVDMVKNRLAQPDAVSKGWLLDGYPRSGEQAEAIEEANIRPDLFFLINVPDEILVERVVGRRSDPKTGLIYHLKFRPPPPEIVDRLVTRSDDTKEMAVARLETYHSNVDSVLSYYQDILVEVDGTKDMEAVFEEISAALQSRLGSETEQVAEAATA